MLTVEKAEELLRTVRTRVTGLTLSQTLDAVMHHACDRPEELREMGQLLCDLAWAWDAERDPGHAQVQEAYREAARNQYGCDGEIDIDDTAIVSMSDEAYAWGAYVAAWLWVYGPRPSEPRAE